MPRLRPTAETGIDALLAAVRSILITVLAIAAAPAGDDARPTDSPTDSTTAPAPTATRTNRGGVSA